MKNISVIMRFVVFGRFDLQVGSHALKETGMDTTVLP